ncbi:DUF308 domain-containing protein [Microbacterium sp. NPDC055988]|uniref:DUF308 domain-containing protein n=1 Tax=Microbacterium sp. NPDC055988 TaxID=3345671 RepID=UPI0035D9C831
MTTTSPRATATNGIRIALGVGGLLALIVGVLILVWPGKTAAIVAAIVAVYAVIAGIVYAALGLFSKTKGGWARIGHVFLGLVFIVAGILAFSNLGQTAAWLGAFISILVAVLWIVEGAVALSTIGHAGSKVWAVLFAIISIAAGIVLLFAPLWGAALLWILLGLSLVVLGVVNIVRALRYGKKTA